MYFDSHVHLNSSPLYEDIDMYIEHALQNGVNEMMVVGFDLESSRKAVEIANQYEFIYAAVGIGPNDCGNITDGDLLEIDEMLTQE